MTDFRALCADLAQQLDDALDFTVSSETRRHMKSLVARARAELAESEPPAKRDVTDEDLDAMWNTEAEYFALYSEARRFARAVLARFGGSPVPVPASEHPDERQGWCDSDGRCWWGRHADSTSNADWFYATWAETIVFCEHSMPQVSLPHDALPLPALSDREPS